LREPGFLAVAAAFLRRDFRVAASYRLGFVLRFLAVVAALATFGVMARFLGGGADEREVPGGYLGFWVTGLAVAELFHFCASAWAMRVREAQQLGTLEAVLSTPAPTSTVVLAAASFDLVVALARFVLYLAVGAIFFAVDFSRVNVVSLLVLLPLALAAFVALGFLGGAMAMALRRTDPISALAWLAAAGLGGVFYPIDALPAWVQPLSWILPVGPALEAFRAAVFAGAAPGALAAPLAALAGFTAVVGGLSAWAMAFALRRARQDGSLTLY
jgi:ABC-2 type transport system permease protein